MKKILQYVGFAVDILPMSTKNVLTIVFCLESFWDEHMKMQSSKTSCEFYPVVGHKIQNYEPQHGCLALNECEPTNLLSVISSTDEKNMSLSIGVLIKTISKKERS